ncbi:MAG: hypothetical protein HY426_01000 [Candidatus Levybacteria bacterium]|nr:hypothetical protein [Candidatus Levybacteria bacterium]
MFGKHSWTFSVFAAVLILILLVVPVFAQETSTTNTTGDDATTTTASPTPKLLRPQAVKDRIQAARQKNLEIRENLKNRASEAAQRRAEKLSEARLKVCHARALAIGNRLKAMHKRATVIHTGHEKIYAKVDEFYNNRLVPNGYSLSNYADLKAEIEANKTNVQTLLDAAKETGTDFDCSSEDPKGQLDAFHEDMKALIEANKTYKESIHAFVKAVRDLAKTAKPEKLSPSPEVGATE